MNGSARGQTSRRRAASTGSWPACSEQGPGIVMSWARDDDEAVLRADLATGSAEVTWTENGTHRHALPAGLP
jgi:hypothetical protein